MGESTDVASIARERLRHFLQPADVLVRLAQGEPLLLDASLSYQSRFLDGTGIPHQVMQSLVDDGLVIKPAARGGQWLMSDGTAP